MLQAQPHVVLLTGLGADERLFDGQRSALPGLLTPGWITPRPCEGLAKYAKRFATEIPVARPLVLGGCSLGGMMAYEMANVLRPDALVLIASAVTRDAIPWRLRALARIAWIAPTPGYGFGKRTYPVLMSLVRRRAAEHRRLAALMARDASSSFLRWACIAVGRWQPSAPPDVPTYTIHGNRDRVLPLGNRACDFLIPGAGHLLTVTHAAQVNAALHEVANRAARAALSPMAADVERERERDRLAVMNNEAYDLGYDAYWGGDDVTNNPYDADDDADAFKSWEIGWRKAREHDYDESDA